MMKALMDKLYSLKRFPSYFGRTIVPANPTAAGLYSGFVKTLNANENRKRNAVAETLQVPSPERKMTREKGYLFADFKDDPLFQEALKFAQAKAKSKDWDELQKTSKKPFLISQPFDLTAAENLPLLKFAMSKAMVEPAADYIGRLPVLTLISLWYSPNKEDEETRSRAFHLDGPDYRQVKCFIPLEDLDEDSGPLCFLPAYESYEAYKFLKQKKIISKFSQRVTDEQMYAICPEEKLVKAVGDVGTVAMVDTNTCYHYGSRKAKKPRLLLVIQYLDPYCTSLPAWNRRNQNFANLEGEMDPHFVETVVGLAHLEFRNAHPGGNTTWVKPKREHV